MFVKAVGSKRTGPTAFIKISAWFTPGYEDGQNRLAKQMDHKWIFFYFHYMDIKSGQNTIQKVTIYVPLNANDIQVSK